jgi:hypothetical protein
LSEGSIQLPVLALDWTPVIGAAAGGGFLLTLGGTTGRAVAKILADREKQRRRTEEEKRQDSIEQAAVRRAIWGKVADEYGPAEAGLLRATTAMANRLTRLVESFDRHERDDELLEGVFRQHAQHHPPPGEYTLWMPPRHVIGNEDRVEEP